MRGNVEGAPPTETYPHSLHDALPTSLPNTVGFRSDANTKNAPPSATPKLTVPVPVLSSAPSRLAPAPSAQDGKTTRVNPTHPTPAQGGSSRDTVSAPLPAPTVTRKLPS